MIYLTDIKTDKLVLRNANSDTLEDIYYLKLRLPKKTELKEEEIERTKKELSIIRDKIPLYDIYSENLYLVTKHNVYNRVVKEHYRIPNKMLIKEIKNKIINPQDPLKDRKERKRELILEFMNIFDLELLENTYFKVFYMYSDEVGKNLTNCKKPSFVIFFKHIHPYYTRNELINTALNMGIIEPNNDYYESKKLELLCENIIPNDISAKTLLSHYKHITKQNRSGIVQYYSLQGSYFINRYLRNLVKYNSKNIFLEELIKTIYNIVKTSPEFDKEYTVYRFIQDDEFMSDLEIGDIFIDPGFVSTTRDPFYNSDEFKFGFILLRINLPKNTKGVGLCMESISHFPKEQEIILPPMSKLKLIKKDNLCRYFHTSANFATKVKTRYEFDFVGTEELEFNREKDFHPLLINFLKLEKSYGLTLEERILNFTRQYSKEQYRFNIMIGDIEYNTVIEWYDSTSAYSDFFAVKSQNGVCMYSITKNFVSFMIELTTDAIYVNYYFHHSLTNRDSKIKDEDLIKFVSSVAYYFEIDTVYIYHDYSIDSYSYSFDNHSLDFYNYLKDKKKRFKNINHLKPRFKYYDLDRLDTFKITDLLDKTDNDELYQLHKRLYDGKDTVRDFYIWLVENYTYLVRQLINKTDKIFNEENPFLNAFYILDPNGYLYSKNFIKVYRDKTKLTKHHNVPKNIYRLNNSMPRATTNRII